MTETQPSLQKVEHMLAGDGPIISSGPPLTNGHLTPIDGPIEDDSTIKCICGFNDDDGLTVLCEDCNTWQHIDCYYPGSVVPDIHQCVNCKPRAIDAKAATERQKQTRFTSIAGERKQKRGPPKSHKKKNRDSVSAIHLNGNTNGDKLHDRNSGSPLEVPPAKRPKTNHRTSSSTTSLTQQAQVNPTRRRTNSIAAHRASPTKSPPNANGFQRPNERFSIEFMQMYDRDYVETTTNSYNNLGTPIALSRWLDDSEEFEKVANGQTQHDVYMRWDSAWQVLEEMSPGVDLQRFEDETVTAHGRHPVFHYLTAERDAGKGAFLGELTGQIAIKHDYETSSKMWPILRHPEPFVFFSDRLPICIDARKEGNKFRFIRRSCQPNSRMQIVIAGKEYRFCLVTEAPILANDEITLPWYIDPRIMDILRASVDQKPISPDDHEYRIKWISGILAHFGRCACNRPDDQCLLSLARTPRFQAQDANGHAVKAPRKKSKKPLTQISPSSTGHATNSRAGSEAVSRFDNTTEIANSPVSDSGPSKSSSRDISPTVAGLEGPIGLGVDLSAREKRKLQEQERLFARLEQDDSRRKKRNSAGSTLNTPTVPSTQIPTGVSDAVSPSPLATTNPKLKTNGRSIIEAKNPSRGRETKSSADLQRAYSEMSTQTEETSEDVKVDASVVRQRRAVGCNYAQRLLIRSRSGRPRGGSNNSSPARDKSSRSPSAIRQTDLAAKTEFDSPLKRHSGNQMPPPPLPSHAVKDTKLTTAAPNPESVASADVEMLDSPVVEPTSNAPSPSSTSDHAAARQAAAPDTSTNLAEATTNALRVSPKVESLDTNESEVSKPIAPTTTSISTTKAAASPPVVKPSLTVELPATIEEPATKSPPVADVKAFSIAQIASEQNITPVIDAPETPTIEKSPTMLRAVLSSSLAPGTSDVAVPSPPPRKKMSLSDWSSRNKKKKIIEAQQAAQNSPLSVGANQSISEDNLMKSPEEEKKPELSSSTNSNPPSSVPIAGDIDPALTDKAPEDGTVGQAAVAENQDVDKASNGITSTATAKEVDVTDSNAAAISPTPTTTVVEATAGGASSQSS